MKHLMRKSYMLLVFSLFFVFTALAVHRAADAADSSAGMNVATRSEAEIKAFASSHPFSLSGSTVYEIAPSTRVPYAPGKPSAKDLTNAMNLVNLVRYIAGIDADVVLKDEYNELAQAASLVNAVNGSLSHDPAHPKDMDEALYQLGRSGAGQSNIGMGHANLGDAIINGWMNDSDSSNISRVGHRRWLLNPAMAATGFGIVDRTQSVYAFDFARESDYVGVAWPARTMPTEFFAGDWAWSFSSGVEEIRSNVKVRLTRKNDGRSWNFSSSSSDGRFFVNNDGFGQKGCIIFRPDSIDSFKPGDEYIVSIDGLSSGENIEYTVRFFSLGINNPNRDDTGYRVVTTESAGCDTGTSILLLAALAIMRLRNRK